VRIGPKQNACFRFSEAVVAKGEAPDRPAWAQFDGFPMAWSLGVLGDLVWLMLPECREAVITLAMERLELDAPYDRELQQIGGYDFVTRAVNP
jgi:hypothetical protein